MMLRSPETENKRRAHIIPGLLALCLFALALLSGCGGASSKPEPTAGPTAETIEVIVPGGKTTPVPAITPAPTPAPTAEPDTLEGKICAGLVYALNNGSPLDSSWAGESIDIDGDGNKERLSIEQVDGGDTFCISGEPFMDGGSEVRLVSFGGRRLAFISQKPGDKGYFIFYPDYDGNLFCRLFAICREGDAESFAVRSSYEEYVRAGLDLMLHNPMLYSLTDGDTRTVRLDMNGDGRREEIVFDSEALTINGEENRAILSTTMPRFIYDAEHDAIVLYGSAGDYALRLRWDGSALYEDISYATLL